MNDRLKAIPRDLCHHATPAERRLWHMIRNRQLHGRKFRRRQPFGRYVVDFYCRAERLVVELDGAVHRDPARADADTRRQRDLKARGLRVVRFSNQDVLEAPDVVCAAIAAHFGPDAAAD